MKTVVVRLCLTERESVILMAVMTGRTTRVRSTDSTWDHDYIEWYYTAQAMDEDCRCETLPNGERICDPYGCDGRKDNRGKKCR